MTRRSAFAHLTLITLVLVVAHCCCDPARGQEIARVEITRPATVVLERTPDGGVRLVIEYQPMGPPAPPKPNPTPDAPEPATVLARAIDRVPVDLRDAFVDCVRRQTAWVLQAEGIKPSEAGAYLATRVVVELGVPATAGALVLADDLDRSADPMGRLRALVAVMGVGE